MQSGMISISGGGFEVAKEPHMQAPAFKRAAAACEERGYTQAWRRADPLSALDTVLERALIDAMKTFEVAFKEEAEAKRRHDRAKEQLDRITFYIDDLIEHLPPAIKVSAT